MGLPDLVCTVKMQGTGRIIVVKLLYLCVCVHACVCVRVCVCVCTHLCICMGLLSRWVGGCLCLCAFTCLCKQNSMHLLAISVRCSSILSATNYLMKPHTTKGMRTEKRSKLGWKMDFSAVKSWNW